MAGSPTFIIIGAPKAGTTALFNYLGKHPDIFCPRRKELNYFSRGYDRLSWEWYTNWFQPKGVQGEATPKYFYDLRTPGLIKKRLPGVKIILLLRDPVARAYSNYRHTWHTDEAGLKQLGENAKLSFEEVLALERRSFESWWPEIERDLLRGDYSFKLSRYCQMFKGHYAYWLKNWLRYFSLDSDMLVIKSEDFFAEENSVLERVHRFLGVNHIPLDSEELLDIGPKTNYIPMSKTTEEYLRSYYENKNDELYKLLGENFKWKA